MAPAWRRLGHVFMRCEFFGHESFAMVRELFLCGWIMSANIKQEKDERD